MSSSESEDGGYRSPSSMTSQEYQAKEKEKELVAVLLKRIVERKNFVTNVLGMMRAKELRDHHNLERIKKEKRSCVKNQMMQKTESKIRHQSRSRNHLHSNENNLENRRADKRKREHSAGNRIGQRSDKHYRTNSSREYRDNHSRPSKSTNGYEQKQLDHYRSSNSRWSNSDKENEFIDDKDKRSESTKRRREDEDGKYCYEYYESSAGRPNAGKREFISTSRNEYEYERERQGSCENDFNFRVGYYLDNQGMIDEAVDLSRSNNIIPPQSRSVQRSVSEIQGLGCSGENKSYSRFIGDGSRIGDEIRNGTRSDYELSYGSIQNEGMDMSNSQQPNRVLYTTRYYNALLKKQRDNTYSRSRSGRYFRPN